MIDYILVFLSVVLLSLGFILQKVYQKQLNNDGSAGAKFNLTSAIFSIILLVILNGFNIEFTWYSFINAFLKTLCGYVYVILGFFIMKRGKMVLYTLFLMSGGMLVPAVWGWIFLNETVLALRVVGVVIILVAIIIPNIGKQKLDLKTFFLCIAVFILNGFVSVFSKLHQSTVEYETVSTTSYALWSTFISLCMSFIYILFTNGLNSKKKTPSDNCDNAPKKNNLKTKKWIIPILIVALYSVVGNISSLLQLEGAKNLPASVLYPMITGGSVVLSGIFALIFFKEKPSKREWIGIFLCLVGTLLFL